MNILEFDNIREAVNFALDNFLRLPFAFKVRGKEEIYSTECVDRYWACKLCPELFFDLFDEEYINEDYNEYQ